MTEVTIEHAHEDERRPMELVRVERIDGLAVEHYRCACGHSIVVLGKVEGEQQGAAWPIHWLTEPPQ